METIKTILTSEAFITIISGVFVFVLSQLFVEYTLNPIKEYKKLKAKIAYSLTFYSCYYGNPAEVIDKAKSDMWIEASKDLRKLASECLSFSQTKPQLNIFIVSKRKLIAVKTDLLLISNSCFYNEGVSQGEMIKSNRNARKEIYNMLRIKDIND